MPRSDPSSCYQNSRSSTQVPEGELNHDAHTPNARLHPCKLADRPSGAQNKPQPPPQDEAAAGASSTRTHSGLNKSRKRKKSDCSDHAELHEVRKEKKSHCSDSVDLAEPYKRPCSGKVPVSHKATRIYKEGGAGWLDDYAIEFRTVVMITIQFWREEKTNPRLGRYPDDLRPEDDDLDDPGLFEKLASDRRLLESIAAESWKSSSQRHQDSFTVLRWGEPAFVEKQRQTLQEQAFVLQKVLHRVQAMDILKNIDFTTLVLQVEERMTRFVDDPRHYYQLYAPDALRTAWSEIEQQVEDTRIPKHGTWDEKLFERLGQSISAIDGELWLWKLMHDEKSDAANQIKSYQDEPSASHV